MTEQRCKHEVTEIVGVGNFPRHPYGTRSQETHRCVQKDGCGRTYETYFHWTGHNSFTTRRVYLDE